MSAALSPYARRLVRRRVEAQMLARVTIIRGTLGVLDPVTGLVTGVTASTTIYTGKARIHPVVGEGTIAVGSGEVDQRQTVISIPWDAPVPARDDLVLIGDDALADKDLKAETYRVLEVSGGTLFGDARRLSCVAWHRSRYWAPS